MAKRLSNAPVYYALAQAQFNPVAAMGKYVDEVQDRLRKSGYPLFEPQQHMQLQIMSGGQPVTQPQVAQTASWLITKADRTSGFILTANALTFHTTHYETSVEFIEEFLRGLNAVHDVVMLEHVSRLGLRYLDAVLPTVGESVDDYFAPGVHGISFGASQRYAMSESVFNTECCPLVNAGTLVLRVLKATATLGFPPDMIPNGLQPMSKFDMTVVRPHGIIDTDHFVEGTMPLDFEKIREQIFSLHSLVGIASRAITTEHARTIWA